MAQQEQSTTDSVLKEKKFKKGDNQADCPICLAQFKPKKTVCELPCQHSFHRRCVERWLRERSPTCPVCRHNVGQKGAEEGAEAAAIRLHRNDRGSEMAVETGTNRIPVMEAMENMRRNDIIHQMEDMYLNNLFIYVEEQMYWMPEYPGVLWAARRY